MKIIYNSKLLKKITFGLKWVSGITLYPFIILKKECKDDHRIINHEKIHIIQQKELLVLPFMLWYAIEFIIRFIIYRDGNKAYANISFEKEAYTNDHNLNYLQDRKLFSYLKYL